MKTQIITLEKDDVTLTLCGAIHIGSELYYKRLNDTACLSDVVVYEMVKSPNKSSKRLYDLIAKLIGLQEQSYYLNEKYVNADIHVDVLNIISKRKYISEQDDLFDMVEKDEKMKDMFKTLFSFVMKNGWFMKLLHKLVLKNEHVVINMRNYIVVAEILKQLETNKSISVIYGQGHLKHLEEQFVKCGFMKTKVGYLDNLEGVKERK